MKESSEYLTAFRMYMLDEKDAADRMAIRFFGTTKLLTRGYVIQQWLLLVDHVHPMFDYRHYKIIRIVEAVNESVKKNKKIQGIYKMRKI
jgi:hypothetical protein